MGGAAIGMALETPPAGDGMARPNAGLCCGKGPGASEAVLACTCSAMETEGVLTAAASPTMVAVENWPGSCAVESAAGPEMAAAGGRTLSTASPPPPLFGASDGAIGVQCAAACMGMASNTDGRDWFGRGREGARRCARARGTCSRAVSE